MTEEYVAVAWDDSVRVINRATGDDQLLGHRNFAYAVAISPLKDRIVTGGGGSLLGTSRLIVWNEDSDGDKVADEADIFPNFPVSNYWLIGIPLFGTLIGVIIWNRRRKGRRFVKRLIDEE